jgi:YegS/Rv2252/BmrU family lipid kinase
MSTDTGIERKEAMIIVNPAAHNAVEPARLKRMLEWIEGEGWKVAVQETEGPGHGVRLAQAAADAGTPVVFACGGDGLLSEAAHALAGSDTALGVIPAGTTNLWARDAGFGKKPFQALKLAANGERRRIDLGRAGSRHFMMMAGFGIDAAVTAATSIRLKGRIGAAAYVITAANVLLQNRRWHTRLQLDDEVFETDVLMLLAANIRNYAGITRIACNARADDGLLDVVVYTGRGRPNIVRLAALTLIGRHLRSRSVIARQVKRLHMEPGRPLPLQIDGDPWPECPDTVEVVPNALWVLAPAGTASAVFSSRPHPRQAAAPSPAAPRTALPPRGTPPETGPSPCP